MCGQNVFTAYNMVNNYVANMDCEACAHLCRRGKQWRFRRWGRSGKPVSARVGLMSRRHFEAFIRQYGVCQRSSHNGRIQVDICTEFLQRLSCKDSWFESVYMSSIL